MDTFKRCPPLPKTIIMKNPLSNIALKSVVSSWIRRTKYFIRYICKQQPTYTMESTPYAAENEISFSPNALVTTFDKKFTPLAEAKGLVYAGIYNSGNITVKGNYERIVEIIDNLLCNAIKCTSNGFVILNVEYVEGMLNICVADSGTGMSEAQIQLFYLSGKRFDYQELPELAGRNLAETLAIVRMLKGSMKVFSDAGKGCKFIIQLPMSVI